MLRRFWALVRGAFGLFLARAERRSPEALFEVEKENLRDLIVRFNQGLAAHAALCERLMTRLRTLEGEEQELRDRAAAHLRCGNTDAAGQSALRLQAVTRELAGNRESLAHSEETYAGLVKARDEAAGTAQAKLDALRRSIDELKAKKALAELSEMAAGMAGPLGSAGDTLDRLRAMVEEERARAVGRVRVARQALPAGETEGLGAERKALADQALAEFAARPAPPKAIAGTPTPGG
jgi:phage shock protein A